MFFPYGSYSFHLFLYLLYKIQSAALFLTRSRLLNFRPGPLVYSKAKTGTCTPSHDLPPTSIPQTLWIIPPIVFLPWPSLFPLSLPFLVLFSSASPGTHLHPSFSCPLSQCLPPPPPSPDSPLPLSCSTQPPHTSQSPSEHLSLSYPGPSHSLKHTQAQVVCVLRSSLCWPYPCPVLLTT